MLAHRGIPQAGRMGDDGCAPASCVSPSTVHATDIYAALRATGALMEEAVPQVLAMVGEHAAKEVWQACLDGCATESPKRFASALDRVAAVDPVVANQWLGMALRHERHPGMFNDGFGLTLRRRDWLTDLPAKTTIRGHLDVLGSPHLREIPSGLVVTGGLTASECPCLTTIKSGVRSDAGTTLFLSGNPSLVKLPNRWHIRGNLDLSGCTSLADLPSSFRVDGSLKLSGCHALKAIPAGLRVGGTLDLTDCPSWDGHVPEDASFRLIYTGPAHGPRVSMYLHQWRAAALQAGGGSHGA